MDFTLRISEFAVFDLQDSYQWYEKQQPDLGSQFLGEYENTQKLILSNPFHYQKKYRQLRHCRLKRFPFPFTFWLMKCISALSPFITPGGAFSSFFPGWVKRQNL